MARVTFALLRNITSLAILLMLASTASGQTTFVLDHFTAGANTLLENHTPNVGGAWTRGTGSGGLTIIGANDNLRNVAAGDWNTQPP